jgi:hypothetical protein
MSSDPYDHVREAFHITADGLMDWNDPPQGAESRSNGLGASYLPQDIDALEAAADALSRAGQIQHAVAMWAIALRIRQAF